MVCSLTILLGAAGSLRGEIIFARDIAHPSIPNAAEAKMDSCGAGNVDVMCTRPGLPLSCSTWLDGLIVIDGEEDVGLPTDGVSIMGISRDRGVLRVGVSCASGLWEYTRAKDGTWMGADTGYECGGAAACDYDVDSRTGFGRFLFRERESGDVVYLRETAANLWEKMVLEPGGDEHSYVESCDLVCNSVGDAIGAYRLFLPDPQGNIEGHHCEVRAGKIRGPGPLNTILRQGSYSYPPQDLAVAPDGTIYMLDTLRVAPGVTEARVYVSEDGGQTWGTDPNGNCRGVLHSGSINTGAHFDSALAVAPDESLIAVLLIVEEELRLFTSWDGGATWDDQIIHAASIIVPPRGRLTGTWDLMIDAAGDLYVAYPGEDDGALHMLSTVPEPATMSLLAIVCALALPRGRVRRTLNVM